MKTFLLLLLFFGSAILSAAPAVFRNDAGPLEIRVYSGPKEEPLHGKFLNPGEWQGQDGLKIILKTQKNADKSTAVLEFSLPGGVSTYALLTVEGVCNAGTPVAFYDGFASHDWNGKTALERNTIQQTFPLAAAWDSRQGIALGLTPDSMVSHMHCGLRRTQDIAEIFYRTRVVVDARMPQQITFCHFSFQPDFGWLDAIESYYQEFPEYFHPAPGIDPRIYGVGGYFVSTHVTRDLEIHSGRQLGLDWEWTYCPWNLAGNWFIEASEWKPDDGYMHWQTYWKRKTCTFEEYQLAERKRFTSGDRQAAMLFYVLIKDTAKEIVKRFPEAQRVNDKGVTIPVSFLHSLPDNQNRTALTFPSGSGLSGFLERELRLAAENYQISGFALDMTNWSGNDYCEAQRNFACGRSFDADGKIFTSDAIVPIPFARYMRTLRRAGKPMAVMMNHALENQPALPIFYADAVMFEGNPEAQLDNFRSLRLMSGQKPLTVWGALGRGNNSAINWHLAQDPEIHSGIIAGLAQYLLFNCLRYGVSPMNWVVEYRDRKYFRPWLSLIRELKRAGWNAVPALRCKDGDRLWFGRFGSGLDTIFTISNPGRASVETTVTLYRKYLKADEYRPKAVTGQVLEPLVTKDVIQLPVHLAAKEIMVLRDQKWQAEKPCGIFGKTEEILDFFSPEAVRSGEISVVIRKEANRGIYGFLDRYYPYRQACHEKDTRNFTREPGMLNPRFNDCWSLTLSDQLGLGRQIAVGSMTDFPELAVLLPTEAAELAGTSGAVILLPEKNVLWICAREGEPVKKAADVFFYFLDQNYQPLTKKEIMR